jgi:plastocyanin
VIHNAGRCACLTACLAFSTAAWGGTVSVHVSDTRGVAVPDALVVLDPLDMMPPIARESASIDQIDRHFVPRLSIVRTGTSVSFPNSDHIRHQVYSFSAAKAFTLKLYAGSPNVAVLFDKPGLIVMGCNIHDSMVGFLAVVDTPYFGKSAVNGTVDLMVPPGRYRLRVWHEKADKVFAANQIAVTQDSAAIPVTLDINAQAGAPPPWVD